MKDRFIDQQRNNINTRGEFVISSNEERFQSRNRTIVLQKIQERLDKAAVPPKERKLRRGSTIRLPLCVEVSKQVKENWVKEKRMHSELKQRRRGKDNNIEHF